MREGSAHGQAHLERARTIAEKIRRPGSRGGGQNAPRAYALGGVAPGYSPGSDTLLAGVSPGDGFLVPEAVRGLGEAPAIHAINAMFASRVPGFSLGDVIGGIGSAIGGVVSGVVDKARQAAAAVALKALEALELPIRAALSLAPSGFAQALGGGLLNNVNSRVHDYIEGKAYDNGGYRPPGLTTVWNGTGAPEPVFTPGQLAQLAAGGIGDVTVHVAIGNEAIDPRMVRITNVTFDNRLTGAKHVAPAGGWPHSTRSTPHMREAHLDNAAQRNATMSEIRDRHLSPVQRTGSVMRMTFGTRT